MAKAKSPAQTRTQRDRKKMDGAGTALNPERPPESAEDFSHVLRRLLPQRNAARERDEARARSERQ